MPLSSAVLSISDTLSFAILDSHDTVQLKVEDVKELVGYVRNTCEIEFDLDYVRSLCIEHKKIPAIKYVRQFSKFLGLDNDLRTCKDFVEQLAALWRI